MGTQGESPLEADVSANMVPHLQLESSRVENQPVRSDAYEAVGGIGDSNAAAMTISTVTTTVTAADPQFPPETPRTPPVHTAPPVTRITIRENQTNAHVTSSADYSDACDCSECFAVVFLSFCLFLLLCLFTPSLLAIAVLDELVRVLSYLTQAVISLARRGCCCLRQQNNPVPAAEPRERLLITVLREVLGFEVGLAAPYTPSTERDIQATIESIEDRDADPIKFTDEEADTLASQYLSMDFLCPISTYTAIQIADWFRVVRGFPTIAHMC